MLGFLLFPLELLELLELLDFLDFLELLPLLLFFPALQLSLLHFPVKDWEIQKIIFFASDRTYILYHHHFFLSFRRLHKFVQDLLNDGCRRIVHYGRLVV